MAAAKVSICIPVYNAAPFIKATIESVLSQDYENLEVLVSDNHSEDGTFDILQELARADRRIVLWRNDSNIGGNPNWNKVLFRASGDYVKLLCADDLLLPGSVSRMVEVLDAHENVALVSSPRYLVDEQGKRFDTWDRFGMTGIFAGSDVIRKSMLVMRNCIGEPSVTMFRRKHCARGFDPKFHFFIDLEMWYHLLAQGDFAFLPEPLSCFRIHSMQGTQQQDRSLYFKDCTNIVDDYASQSYLSFPPLIVRYLYYDKLLKIRKAHAEGTVSDSFLQDAEDHYGSRYGMSKIMYRILTPFVKGWEKIPLRRKEVL